jgi:uncharacterized protein (TIGR03437 family)
MSVLSAASFARGGSIAPDSIVTGFTTAIPDTSAAAPGATLPVTLGGYSVSVRDSAGMSRDAGLISVARGQISFVIPAGTAQGAATFTLRRGDATAASGTATIARVAPALFTANATGDGPPAGYVIQIARDGSRVRDNLFETLPGQTKFEARPFDLEWEERDYYLELYGTGIRGAAASSVRASISGVSIPVLAAQAQGGYAGLDQVNLGPVPRSLARKRPLADLELTVDGVAANKVTLAPTYPPYGGWGDRAPLLEANSEMSVAYLNGKVYVLGGYPASRVTVRTVQVYDIATDTWRLTTQLPVGVNHSMPAVVGGKIYLIGGQTDANAAYVNVVQEYDPATETWRMRAPMPTARGGGAATVLDGKIYVAGARPPRGADFAVYDPAKDEWATLPDLPTQRNHLGTVTVGGKIYVVGGRFEGGFTSTQSDAIEFYDPRTSTWAAGAPMPKPRGGINVAEAYGCIHVFGGEFATGVHAEHDMYNPVTNQWSHVGHLPTPIHGVTGAYLIDGLIYLPGGGTMQGGSSGSRLHQVYRPNQVCR